MSTVAVELPEEALERVAELRRFTAYPDYRDSGEPWLGQVPNHWSQKRIKFAANLINEKAAAATADSLYVGLENIESKTGRLVELDAESTVDGLSNTFKASDVLFGKLRPYLAKAVHTDFDGLCSSELLVLRPRDVCGRYLFYCMLAPEFINVVDSSTYGAKMPRASWEFIGNLQLTLPPLAERRAITAFLDRETARIDELVQKKERLIELLQEKRTALITRREIRC
ncbi:MAG: restriction endonuclease subunit S [Planctomycetes bacterium]|nr:restriction endonuclease subunit S [Planctomycetota bacterium]